MDDFIDQKGFGMGIGGIKGGYMGAKVMHIITYKTPFFVNRNQM